MCTPHTTLDNYYACERLRCTIERKQDTEENTYDMQFGTVQGDSAVAGKIYIAPQRVRVQIGTDAAIVLGGPLMEKTTDYYYSYDVT